MKRLFTALISVALLTAFPWRVVADIGTIQKPAVLSSAAPAAFVRCNGGQSTATVQAIATTIPGPTPTPSPTPPATPTPGPTSTPIAWAGVVSIYTAADIGNAPGPTAAPYYATPAPTYSSAPFKAYVKLVSDQWLYAVLTTATQGNIKVWLTCSAAAP